MALSPHNDWPRETILIVEDADSIRKMLCAMLMQKGYDCLEAADGAEALRLLENSAGVQLVITDVVMPNMTGAELARHLSQTRPEVRIIFMSGYTDDPIVRSIEHIPGLFLAKPFTSAALMERVREVLERPWEGLQKVAGSFPAP